MNYCRKIYKCSMWMTKRSQLGIQRITLFRRRNPRKTVSISQPFNCQQTINSINPGIDRFHRIFLTAVCKKNLLIGLMLWYLQNYFKIVGNHSFSQLYLYHASLYKKLDEYYIEDLKSHYLASEHFENILKTLNLQKILVGETTDPPSFRNSTGSKRVLILSLRYRKYPISYRAVRICC